MAFMGLRRWLMRGRHGPQQAERLSPGSPPADVPSIGRHTGAEPAATTLAIDRLAVAEELWGTGFLTPGGAGEILRYAAPIGLSAASTLLLIGAGAGGPASTLATELGVWVSGHEEDPELAALAARRLQRAGAALAKRATVTGWSRTAAAFPARHAHHALAIEAVREATAEPVLDGVARALRPHGHIVLVETVAAAPLDAADPAVAAWCRLEGRVPLLPQPEPITRALSRLGFDVRVVEDMSARHMRLAVLGWKLLVRRMATERPTPARAAAVVAEAERWTRRVRLMHAGHIRLMRWHAIGPGGPRP